jgi:predicted metallo-beta-lactamase superfamily hydrolase
VQIEVLGADSFGVRSLATFVVASKISVLIDPGVSVCPKRDGKPPHALELEQLRKTRSAIQQRAEAADAIIITHFHHDHYSSFEERDLDLTSAETARTLYGDKPVYVKAWQRKLNHAQKRRAIEFVRNLGRRVTIADDKAFEHFAFSPAVKHGEADSKQGWVVMVLMDDGKERTVFGSDIQLIEPESVNWIIEQRPDTLIVSGPPTYLRALSGDSQAKAQANLSRLAEAVPTVVIDHHLLRTLDYEVFLSGPRHLAARSSHHILTAAEFMGRPNSLLEARRKHLMGSELTN